MDCPLDPKWMSYPLSALHEAFNPEDKGNYSRKWALIFMLVFSIIVSLSFELIINEMFKRVVIEKSAIRNNIDPLQD